MRFSIGFLVLLTLWAAVAVQTLNGYRQHRNSLLELARTKAKEAEIRSYIALLKTQGLAEQLKAQQAELEEQSRMLDCLVEEFESKVPELLTLPSAPNAVVVRSIPVLKEPNSHVHLVKLAIPPERKITLELSMHWDGQLGEQMKGEQQTMSPDFEGEHPWSYPLPAGTHMVELAFRYGDQVPRPCFAIELDSEEIGRWECYEDEVRGYGSSNPNWREPSLYEQGRKLPNLIEIRPSDFSTELRVRLADLDRGEPSP